MEKQRIYIDVKSQRANLKIVSSLKDTLTLPETGVLWQKGDTEYIFFSTEKWERFVGEMKKKSGMTPNQLHFTKQWGDFLRGLCGRWSLITIKESIMRIDPGCVMKQRLAEWISRVEICI